MPRRGSARTLVPRRREFATLSDRRPDLGHLEAQGPSMSITVAGQRRILTGFAVRNVFSSHDRNAVGHLTHNRWSHESGTGAHTSGMRYTASRIAATHPRTAGRADRHRHPAGPTPHTTRRPRQRIARLREEA